MKFSFLLAALLTLSLTACADANTDIAQDMPADATLELQTPIAEDAPLDLKMPADDEVPTNDEAPTNVEAL